MSVLIIAEGGVNHNGDIALALRLVDAAADAGADIIKFQTFTADSLVTESAKKADYQAKATGEIGSQHSMLKALELSPDDHRVLMRRCAERRIGFLSTAFDLASLALLQQLGLEIYKVPSGELTNLPYLRRIGGFGKRVILSTGMSSMGEIEAAINALIQAGSSRHMITVLHCNTEYPTPMCDVNLRAMVNIGAAFGVVVGYSDHTAGTEVPVAAVALGAKVIEKHLTLDKSLPGPDHLASLEPSEFASMVRGIRNVELALGDGIKQPTISEMKNMAVARKSIVASCRISPGTVLSPENLSTKRPGTGISPLRWDEVVGRKAIRGFEKDEPIEI